MSEEVREPVIDRTGWPPGAWDAEPDRWEDRHAGLPVLAVRNHRGAWCGYVALPPDHPWRASGADVDELATAAHGGITYAGLCNGLICHVPREGEPADVMWIGFDCNHAGDLAPSSLCGSAKEIRDEVERKYGPFKNTDVYRDLAYVQTRVRAMAEQAAAAR